ncbi:alpha-xylosidase BoGH31A [Lachnospiraceae bacterium]|nr:alpha-xylosidase BoGH31A [Lachnospiraceae bacterium]
MLIERNGKLFRRYDKELLCIEPYGVNGLRIRATELADFQDDTLSALIEPEHKTYDTEIAIEGDSACIRNGKLRCEVLCTGKMKFYNQKGELILEEYDKNRLRPNAPGEADSALEIIPRTFIPHPGTNNYSLHVRFEAEEGERFYGMGQYAYPFLNLKGCVMELSQRNSQITIPFTISSRGYGFLWNNPAIGRAAFGRNITEWYADSTKQMDYWITAGDTPSEIEEAYAEVVGKVPMMPDYGTGFWQCKLRYRTQEELLSVAREYKCRGLPISVIVIDFFHWTAQGDWKFDPKFWPDPEQMVKELKEMGIELMVSIWPTVEEKSENYKYMEEMGYLIRTEMGPRMGIKNKDTYMDATNPHARSFVWGRIKEHYYDKGIHLFWLDECEPEVTKYEYDNYRFYAGSHKEAGNIYPREFARMAYEGRKKEGEERILSLTRCAWVGSQKYGALVWTGDIASDFATLKTQVRAGMNMSLSGFPWWTTDIGGFHGGNIHSEEFKECFARWFEFGAFCPVFRLHGFRQPLVVESGKTAYQGGNAEGWIYTSGAPNEVWSYGDEIYEICKKYMFLREKIRPYIQEQMRQAHEKGTPVMRPLFYEFPDDGRAWDVEDAFLLGPDILVSPVTEKGRREQMVYLPEGNWKNIDTGEIFSGRQSVCCRAELDTIPVFVKADRIDIILPKEM